MQVKLQLQTIITMIQEIFTPFFYSYAIHK